MSWEASDGVDRANALLTFYYIDDIIATAKSMRKPII
jgi:hypothetical protein